MAKIKNGRQRSYYLTERHIKTLGIAAAQQGIEKSELVRNMIENTYPEIYMSLEE